MQTNNILFRSQFVGKNGMASYNKINNTNNSKLKKTNEGEKC